MRHPWERSIQERRTSMAALARAVQRPSLWENGLHVPKDRECVRCFRLLDPDRQAMCERCWGDCPDCDGAGAITHASLQVECATCNGTGRTAA